MAQSSNYLYQELLKLLGGSKLLGGEDIQYGNWSPNGVKTVVITSSFLMVEYHKPYVKGSVPYSSQTLDVNKVLRDKVTNPKSISNILGLLYRYKNFYTLEEVIIDRSLVDDDFNFSGFLNNMVSQQNNGKFRFRLLSIISWNPGSFSEFSNMVTKLRENSSTDLLAPIYAKAVGSQYVQPSEGIASKDWFSKFYLNPRDYQADLKDGKLYQYFVEIARGFGVEVDNDTASNVLTQAEEDNYNVIHSLVMKDLDYIPDSAQILKVLHDYSKKDADSKKDYIQRKIYTTFREVISNHRIVPGLGFYLEHLPDPSVLPEGADILLKQTGRKVYRLLHLAGAPKVSSADLESYLGQDKAQGIIQRWFTAWLKEAMRSTGSDLTPSERELLEQTLGDVSPRTMLGTFSAIWNFSDRLEEYRQNQPQDEEDTLSQEMSWVFLSRWGQELGLSHCNSFLKSLPLQHREQVQSLCRMFQFTVTPEIRQEFTDEYPSVMRLFTETSDVDSVQGSVLELIALVYNYMFLSHAKPNIEQLLESLQTTSEGIVTPQVQGGFLKFEVNGEVPSTVNSLVKKILEKFAKSLA